MQQTQMSSLDREDPLEKGMAAHPSILARSIPWTEEPGRLQCMGCKESDMTELIGQDMVSNIPLCIHIFFIHSSVNAYLGCFHVLAAGIFLN